MAKLHTPLCDLLGIRLPIIQAPMASASTLDRWTRNCAPH